MSDFGWREKQSTEEWLYAEGYRFDFYQAVRLLEWLHPKAVSPGEGPEPSHEPVEFRSRPSFDFPASDVHEVVRSAENGPPRMTVNFLALAGAHGPLPAPFTEMLLDALHRKDTALRDFLDVFHHRLVSLMYRVRRTHWPALTARPPHEGPIAESLFALAGLGLPALRNRLSVPDRALLHFAGLMVQHPHSVAGLSALLSGYFHLPINVTQFEGTWCDLSPDQHTRLGTTGQNQILGACVVLGTRVWNQQARISIRIGPMRLTTFTELLPSGSGYLALCDLAALYLGPETAFRFVLTLSAADVPEMRLGRTRLGHTSWLKTRQPIRDDSQVKLRGKG